MSYKSGLRLKKTPKYISKKPNGLYQVLIYSKRDKRNYFVGVYTTVNESVKERDKFVLENIDGCMKGYNPRGITYNKKHNMYKAYINIDSQEFYLGFFPTLEEAVKERNEVLDSLK